MSTKKRHHLQRPPKNKKVGPQNNRTGLIFVIAVLVIMFGLIAIYVIASLS